VDIYPDERAPSSHIKPAYRRGESRRHLIPPATTLLCWPARRLEINTMWTESDDLRILT
jgi:hypothetical protein